MAGEKEYEHEIALDDGPGTGGEVEVDLEPKKPGEKTDELQVEIVEDDPSDAPEKPAHVAKDAPVTPPPRTGPDPEVLELRKRIEAIQNDQARRDMQLAKGYADYEDREIDGKIAAVRERYKKAMSDGDSEASLAATDELTDLKVTKKARELQREAAERQIQTQPQQQQPAQENPLTSRWKVMNPWYGRRDFQAETLALRAIDSTMVDEGWQPNSEAYFDEMARRMKDKIPSVPIVGLTAPRKDNPPPRTAPARSPRTTTKPGVVRLDQGDLRIMRQVGLDPDSKTDRIAYAKQKLAYGE